MGDLAGVLFGLRKALGERVIQQSFHFSRSLFRKATLFLTQFPLLFAKFPLLRAQFSLLGADLPLSLAGLALDFTELPLQFSQGALKVA